MIKTTYVFISLSSILIFITGSATEQSFTFTGVLLSFLFIAFLLALNILFVISEYSIINVSPPQLEEMMNEGNTTAKVILDVIKSPTKLDDYIATSQVGITLVAVGLGMYGEPTIAGYVEYITEVLLNIHLDPTVLHTMSYIIALTLLTYVHIVVGEILPKSISLFDAMRSTMIVARPMYFIQIIFRLPVVFLNTVSIMTLNLFGLTPPEGHERLHSPEEIEEIVTESAQGGLLDEKERELISNIFDFSDRQVYQILRPRRKLEAISIDTSLDKVFTFVADSYYSRFPVYEEDLDHIIGILHSKDLVKQAIKNNDSFELKDLLRPAPVVPEHYPVKKLLTALKQERIHMAIVIDEYGGTAGVVTLEDLVEEILGEVRDEFDVEQEPILKLEPGKLEVSGNFLLDNLEEFVYIGEEDDLPDVETVGGLIVTELGRPPAQGDTVIFDNRITFTVLSVDGLAVARARVEYDEDESDTDEDE